MNRVTARAHAMKLIYEWEMGGEGGDATRLNLLETEPGEDEYAYMNGVFDGVVANVAELDRRIEAHSRGWRLDRISRVDLSILRLGAYELMAGQTPASVVVNEAVELAKQYSGDKAPQFINGVLGGISRAEAQ